MSRHSLLLLSVLFVLGDSHAQWSKTELSQYKDHMAVAVAGSKAYFGGGFAVNASQTAQVSTDVVEIYDARTGQWTFDKLSMARDWLEGVSLGSKVFFAGGWDSIGNLKTRVDIYDTLSLQWSRAELSEARRMMSPVSSGQLVMFAGGQTMEGVSSRVDVFDTQTNLWSAMELSEPRLGLSAAAAGDLVLFAGGLFFDGQIGSEVVKDVVDIYNRQTGTWSKAALSEPRLFMASAVVGSKILFAGGQNINGPSRRVDIFDVSNGQWSIDSLSEARAFDNNNQNAAVVCGKAYFVGGMFRSATNYLKDFKTIDVYDPISQSWKIDSLPYPLLGHSVASVEDKLLVAGGFTLFPQGFIDVHKEVHIFSCTSTGLKEQKELVPDLHVFPNPCSGFFSISVPEDMDLSAAVLTLQDLCGNVLISQTGSDILNKLDVSRLEAGVYMVELRQGLLIYRSKVLIYE